MSESLVQLPSAQIVNAFALSCNSEEIEKWGNQNQVITIVYDMGTGA